jgi:malonate transporter and related proteins
LSLATILGAMFPVFGLIGVGYGCGRTNLLRDHAFDVLNRFVILVTLPVLTFRTLVGLRATGAAAPLTVIAVLGGAFAVYAIGFAVERALGRTPAEANISGLAACFSNTGFIGLPIALMAFGPASLAPVAISMALYASVVFGVAIAVSEVAGARHDWVAGLRRAGRALSRSPLIVLSALGVVWSALRLPMWAPLDTLLATLAAATAPCALVAIGLFIALPRTAAAPGPIARAVGLKLVLHPLATAGLALLLPHPSPLWAATAVLMAAMPAGASSFVLAGGAGRWAMELSAWAVTLTTALAGFTLVPTLWLLGRYVA